MESSLFLCFRGIEAPEADDDKVQDIISGRCFIKHLAKHDELFGMLWPDFQEPILTVKNSTQSIKNWNIITTVLDDWGLEIAPDILFAIISGQETVAIHLANELREINKPDDKKKERTALRRVGPVVPLRQRVNPFLGTPLNQVASENPGRTVAAAVVQPTRLFVHDPNRFNRKRILFVEQIEKLREKEQRLKRLAAKKEKEEKQRLLEASKHGANAERLRAEEQFINETLMMHRADPEKLAEKKRKTELLSKLEVLEHDYQKDEKKIGRLKINITVDPGHKKSAQRSVQPISPRRSHSPQRERPKSPPKIKSQSAIPFDKHATKKGTSSKSDVGWHYESFRKPEDRKKKQTAEKKEEED